MSLLTFTPTLPPMRPLPSIPNLSPQKGTTQDRVSDSFILVGTIAGLFLVSHLAKAGSVYRIGSWRTRQLYPTTTRLWPHPAARNPRSNQDIFDTVIAKYKAQTSGSLSRFDLVDALLAEKGIQTRTFQLPDFTHITIIDMRGLKAKGLNLNYVNFSRKSHSVRDTNKVIIDFTGAQFDRMRLKSCYFENCIFDETAFSGFEFTETYFTRCQFGRNSKLQGRLDLGHFQECQFNDARIDGTLFKGSVQNPIGFTNCRFQGSSVENCRFEKFAFESEWGDPLPSIRSTTFSRSEFSGGNFNYPHIMESSFRGCRFRGVGFSTRFRLFSVDFSSLPKTEPTGQTFFEECYFGIQGEMRDCQFRAVDFLSTNFSSGGSNKIIVFEKCDFSRATFRPRPQRSAHTAGFSGCEFRRCDFTGAKFDPAVRFDGTADATTFDSCDFTDAWFCIKLPDGRMKGVRMIASDVRWRGWNIFRGTRLDDVQLRSSLAVQHPPGWSAPLPSPPSPTWRPIEGDFTGASLVDTDLYDRDFGRSLFAANLRGAACQLTDFSRCRDLEKAFVDGRTVLRDARLPKRLRGRSPIGILGLSQGATFF